MSTLNRMPPALAYALVIAGIFVVMFGCFGVMIALFIPLVEPEAAAAFADTEFLAAMIGIGCPMIIGAIGLSTLLVLAMRGNIAKQVTPIFQAAGLAPVSGAAGARYEGVREGRTVRGSYSRRHSTSGGTMPSHYTGSTVTISVEAPKLATRMSILYKNAVAEAAAGLFKHEPVETDETVYADKAILAHEPGWARRFALDKRVVAAIPRLMLSPTGFVPTITLGVGWVELTVTGIQERELTAEIVQAWLDDLLKVAAAADDQPSPAEPLQPSALEKALTTGDSRSILLAGGGFIGLIVVFMILGFLFTGCLIAIAFVMASLQ